MEMVLSEGCGEQQWFGVQDSFIQVDLLHGE